MIHRHHELKSSFSLAEAHFSQQFTILSIFSLVIRPFNRYLPQLVFGRRYQSKVMNLTKHKTAYHQPFRSFFALTNFRIKSHVFSTRRSANTKRITPIEFEI